MTRTIILTPYPFQEAVCWAGSPVVTPNSRAASTLDVPPQTLETLAHRRLRDIGFAIASPLAAHQALRCAIEEMLSPADPDGFARSLAPALRELFRAGADPAALESIGSERVRRLARVARVYQARLRQAGCVDPAEALWEAIRSGPPRQAVRVYGYARLGADERAFLDAIAGDGSELLLPYQPHPLFADSDETVRYLEQRGWRVETREREPLVMGERLARRYVERGLPAEAAMDHVYPHLEAEVRGALAQIKILLSRGVGADEIALVVRDEALYGPTVLAIAAEYGLPLRALYAVPLSETRVGSWVRLLFEAMLGRFPFEPTVRLLGHALGPGLTDEQWRGARKKHPSGPEAWGRLGIDLSDLDWPDRAARGEYTCRLRALLDDDRRRRAAPWARETIALATLRESLGELESPEAERVRLDRFAREVLAALSLLTAPAQPGRGGVELHTPLSLFGARYRHVFVLGAAEGVLPAPVRDDPALDFHEREALARAGVHLESAAESGRREALSFWLLLQTAGESLTLSYPQLIGHQPTLPGPYFAALGLDPASAPVLPAASPEEARRVFLRQEGLEEDRVLPAARHSWVVERRREGPEPPDEHDGVVGLPLDPSERVFSALQLTELGQCPFRWFAGHLLRLAEPEEAEEGLTPPLRGRLYHRALQRGLQRRPDGDARQGLLEVLNEAFQEAERELGTPPLPAWEACRAELLDELRRAVEAPEFIAEGAEVVALESRFETIWAGLHVEGRVDRIDRLPEGLIVIDYKSGRQLSDGIKDAEGRAKNDIQLPLYREAAAPALFPGEEVAAARYYSLAKAECLPATGDAAALAGLAESVRRRLAEGSYPVDPDIDQKVCQYCPFDLVCRRGARLSRKGTVA